MDEINFYINSILKIYISSYDFPFNKLSTMIFEYRIIHK